MKPLIALEIIKNAPTIYVGCGSDIYTSYLSECIEIENSLKALEIIIKRSVDIPAFKRLLYSHGREENKHMLNVWNFYAGYGQTLTIEEFELVKEVLNELR